MGELVEAYRRDNAVKQALLDRLRDIYGDKVFTDEIAVLNNDQLLELSDNLKKGIPIATPVFDGARMSDIEAMLTQAGLDTSGQVVLVDGRTGEPFERKVTVGYIYMLKLHHLVDDKIHARSIGAIQPGHAAAPGRQGAVRRTALWRDGSVGAGGLRRGLYAAGNADGEIR